MQQVNLLPVLYGLRYLRRALLLMLALMLLLAVIGFVRIAPALLRIPDSLDFAAYYVAARVLNAGDPLYDPAEMIGAATSDGQQVRFAAYIYPPFTAVLLRPLAVLPFSTAKTLWFVLNLVCLFVSLGLLAHLVQLPWRWLAIIAAIACLMPPVYDTLLLGQMNCVLLLLIVGSLYLTIAYPPTMKSAIGAGLLLGVAVSIKLFPIIIVAAYLIYRRYGVVLSTIAATLVISTIGVVIGGIANTQHYFNVVAPQLTGISPLPVEQSIWSVLLRCFSTNRIEFPYLTTTNMVSVVLRPVVEAPAVGYGLSFAFSAIVLVVSGLAMLKTRAIRDRGQGMLLCASLSISVFMVANTVVHDHYHMLQLVPVILLVTLYRQMVNQHRQMLLGFMLVTYCLCIVMQRFWRVIINLVASPLLLAFGFMGALIVWVALVYVAFTGSQIINSNVLVE